MDASLGLIVVLLFVVIVVVAIVVVVAVVALGVLAGASVSRAAATKAPRAVAITPIASAADGRDATVAGQARRHGPLATAPLTGAEVLAYRAVLEILEKRVDSVLEVGHHGISDWKVVHVEEHLPDFLLVDGTGEAQVVCAGRAELESASPATESFGGLRAPSAAVRAFLAGARYEPPGRLATKIHRLSVHSVAEGDRVEASGRARWSDTPAVAGGGLRSPARRLLVEGGTGPVRIRCGGGP